MNLRCWLFGHRKEIMSGVDLAKEPFTISAMATANFCRWCRRLRDVTWHSFDTKERKSKLSPDARDLQFD